MVDKLGDCGYTGSEGEHVPAALPREAESGCDACQESEPERVVPERGCVCADAAFFEKHRERIQAIVGPYRLYKPGEETIEQLMVAK